MCPVVRTAGGGDGQPICRVALLPKFRRQGRLRPGGNIIEKILGGAEPLAQTRLPAVSAALPFKKIIKNAREVVRFSVRISTCTWGSERRRRIRFTGADL